MNTLFTYNPKYFTAHYSLFISLLCWVGSQSAGFCLPLPSSSVNMGVVTRNNDGSSLGTVMLSPVAAPLPNLSSPMSVSAVEPNKCYRLVSRLSGKVLGITGSAQNDGDKLVQQTDANQLTQGWRFTPTDGGYYSITILSTQKGIQVANSSSANDALLEQWTYWGGSHQQWRLVRNAEGYFSLINRNSNKAITVRNSSTAEGAPISQQTLGSGQQQQWSIEERSCTTEAINQPPVVVATTSSLTGTAPLSVTFTGDKSYDPEGDPLTYEWQFYSSDSDREYVQGANQVRVFSPKPGKSGVGVITRFFALLTVTDSKGLKSTSQVFTIQLTDTAPTAKITNPVNNAKYALDKSTSYTLAANITNAGSDNSILWQVKLRRGTSEQLITTRSDNNPVVDLSPVGCDGVDTYYLISLTVTGIGRTASAQDSVKIYPDCTTPNLLVTNLTATPYNTVSDVRVSWTNPATPFDEVLVVGKAGSGFTDIPLGIDYTANASFTGNGTDLYGGKVLYKGTGISVLVTDLTAGQRYYFRVYTRKGNGWNGGVEVSATPATSNRPPVVVAESTSLTGTSPLSVTFTGSNSSDPDGDPITYEWDFGDGSFSSEANPVHTFTIMPGRQGVPQLSYSVKLKVTDNKGGISFSQTLVVSLRNSELAIDPNKCYRLVSRLSGKVLGVSGSAQNDGDKLVQQTDANQLTQGWRFTPADGGYYSITVLSTQKGIQVANFSSADDALLEQWTYWGGSHQQWSAQRNAEGYYTFSNRNSSKAITVRNASTAEGAEISQQTLGAGQQQQWSVQERTCPAGARLGAVETGVAVRLWPNPARDHVLIDLSPVIGQPVGLQLNDLLGHPLQQTKLEVAPAEPYRLNTSQLPDGLYLIQVTPTGQSPTTLRLLIQR